MATPKQLIEAVLRHQVFLERLKANELKQLLRAVDKLNAQARDLVLKLDSPERLNKIPKAKIDKLIQDLTLLSEKGLGLAITDFNKSLEGLAGYSAAFEARAIVATAAKVRLAVPDAAKAYKKALARPISATGQRLQDFQSTWTRGEAELLNRTVTKAWAEGWTVPQLTRKIRGTKELNFKDGILATSKRNAEAIGRTSIQHVASMGRQATWEENKDVVEGFQYVATLDSKTTQVCRSLDGKVFKVGEGPVPPVHINCRSTTVAKLDPELDFLDEGATRSSVNGYVNADLSYYEWLKTQPASFQNEALGPTRAKLFREGGLTSEQFSKLNLSKTFEPLTLEEMKKLEPLAFERANIKT